MLILSSNTQIMKYINFTVLNFMKHEYDFVWKARAEANQIIFPVNIYIMLIVEPINLVFTALHRCPFF